MNNDVIEIDLQSIEIEDTPVLLANCWNLFS